MFVKRFRDSEWLERYINFSIIILLFIINTDVIEHLLDLQQVPSFLLFCCVYEQESNIMLMLIRLTHISEYLLSLIDVLIKINGKKTISKNKMIGTCSKSKHLLTYYNHDTLYVCKISMKIGY